MVAHLLPAQLLGLPVDAVTLGAGAVQGADGLDAAQQLHYGAVHVGLGVHKFHPDTLLGADLPEDDEGAHGNDQDHQAGHREGQLPEDGDDGCHAGEDRGGKIHEEQLDEFDGALQAAVEPPVDVAGHVAPEVGEGGHQQGEGGPLAGVLLGLGGGVLHDEAPDDLDDLIDHIDQQDHQQDGQYRLEGGAAGCQHVVGQVADGQRCELAEHGRHGQNGQNQEKFQLLLLWQQGKDLFPDFAGLLVCGHAEAQPFRELHRREIASILSYFVRPENGPRREFATKKAQGRTLCGGYGLAVGAGAGLSGGYSP